VRACPLYTHLHYIYSWEDGKRFTHSFRGWKWGSPRPCEFTKLGKRRLVEFRWPPDLDIVGSFPHGHSGHARKVGRRQDAQGVFVPTPQIQPLPIGARIHHRRLMAEASHVPDGAAGRFNDGQRAPCVGPTRGAILALASSAAQMTCGLLLLGAYSAGLVLLC
jgi:hypothetical protein